jgi:hypothetical protein
MAEIDHTPQAVQPSTPDTPPAVAPRRRSRALLAAAAAIVIRLILPTNGPSRTYVFWGVVDGKPLALTSFDVTPGSAGPQPLRWPVIADVLRPFAVIGTLTSGMSSSRLVA